MDFFDLIPIVPPDPPGSPSSDRSPEENVAAAVGVGLLPIVTFLVVLFTSVWKAPGLALVALPLGAAAISALLCRLLGARTGRAIATTVGSGLACFVAGAIAVGLAAFTQFFSDF